MLDRLNLPRRLSPRLWLLTVPSALISFERRQNVPRLPIGALRFTGIPVIAAGLALGFWSWRNPRSTIQLPGPAQPLAEQPATIAGPLTLASYNKSQDDALPTRARFGGSKGTNRLAPVRGNDCRCRWNSTCCKRLVCER